MTPQQRWRLKNKEKSLAIQRTWRAKNPQKLEEYKARRKSVHLERDRLAGRRRAAERRKDSKVHAREHVYGLARYARARALVTKATNRPCLDCGGIFHFSAMDFDHVRGKKLFTIGAGIVRALKKVMDEIAKCDLVCANCHRVRTYKRRAAPDLSDIIEEMEA